MRNDVKDNLIVEMTFQFSIKIMTYADDLIAMRRFRIGDQLFRSGTGIGSNVREAQNAESKADFIHKMKVAAKEADETDYWLNLCNYLNDHKPPMELFQDLKSISRVLNKIISSSKKSNQL